MLIRWKLLILLLSMALIPLLIVAWFDQRATQRAGRELAAMNHRLLVEGASRSLSQLVSDYAIIVRRGRELLELALHLQAGQVEKALAGGLGPALPVYSERDFNQSAPSPPGLVASGEHLVVQGGSLKPLNVSYVTQVLKPGPTQSPQAAAAEAAKLSGLSAAYQFLERRHPKLIYWQSTVLESGLVSVYPGHSVFPSGYEARREEWYLRAKETDALVWSPPRPDPFTAQTVFTASRPVYRPDGALAGVTAIDVTLFGLLQIGTLATEWSQSMRTLLVALSFKPGADELGLKVIADYKPRATEPSPGLDWLDSTDRPQLKTVLQEMAAGRSGVGQLAFAGRPSLWAWGTIDQGRTFLVFIMPHEEVTSEAAAAERYVLDRTKEQLTFTGLILAGVIILVTVVAFFGSRSVTRPVRALLGVARRIAEGDLSARTRIKSRDELGQLARSFDDMIPKLRDRMQLRQSLNLAREVQQHLLPAAPPRLSGFDIAGRSVYSDQTGGDYFDFITLGRAEEELLGVAVGDVTGHGLAAALLMTTARAMLRSLSAGPGRLAEMMAAVNHRLAADVHAGRYMTLFYLVLSGQTRSLHWVSAGHDPALVYDPETDSFSDLAGTDVPLGIQPEWGFTEYHRPGWRSGQIILLGTDGIWETRDPGGEMYGKERLKDLIRAQARASAADLLEHLTRNLTSFRRQRPQADDVTAVVIKVE